jgi:rRNA maturation endonuclease Nob1
MRHTGEWKRLAELVNDCYNMDITRCSSFSERLNEEVLKERTEDKIAKQKSFKWKCSACGQTFTKISSRTPKWYMHPKGYTHKNCPCGKGYVMSEYYNYKLI